MTYFDLEEIAEQTAAPVGAGGGLKRRWGVNPALGRCRAARPKPAPASPVSPPVAAPEVKEYFDPTPAPARTWTVASRDGLREMLCSRKADLDISGELIDSLAGLPDRLFSKISCGTKRAGPTSLPALVGALALRVAAIDVNDPGAFLELSRARSDQLQVLFTCLDQGYLVLHFQECPTKAARMRKRWVKRRPNGPRLPRPEQPAA